MNLSKYSSQELRQLRKDIDKELKSRRRQEIKEAQRELKTVAEKYGFALNELVSAQSSGKKKTGAVRFRHPEDSSKTWSGRGRKPVWVKQWEESGQSLDELRV